MKVILRDEVEFLGKAGQAVEVKDGYARNYLLPKKLAVTATAKGLKALEHEHRLIADKIRKEKSAVEKTAEQISGLALSIAVQVGEEGKLFGSVTNKDIAELLAEKGFDLDKRKIKLEHPIKELGRFSVPISLQHDVEATVTVSVVQAE